MGKSGLRLPPPWNPSRMYLLCVLYSNFFFSIFMMSNLYPVNPAKEGPQLIRPHCGIVGRRVTGEHIDVRPPDPVVGPRLFGEPPCVLRMDDPRVYVFCEPGFLLNLPPGCFNPHPIPVLYLTLAGCLRMYFHERVSVMLPERGNLAMFGTEEILRPPARC